MGYKPTTQIYALRAESSFTVNTSSTSASGGLEIDTNLDTLSREVLLIWEIDINPPTLGTQIGDVMGSTGTSSFTYHGYISKNDESNQLNDSEYVGGYRANICHPNASSSVVMNANWNPDTRAFASNTGQDSPLGIITADKVYFRQGYERDTSLKSADSLTAQCRMMVQRAKADADTYAALLMGASL